MLWERERESGECFIDSNVIIVVVADKHEIEKKRLTSVLRIVNRDVRLITIWIPIIKIVKIISEIQFWQIFIFLFLSNLKQKKNKMKMKIGIKFYISLNKFGYSWKKKAAN